MFKKFLTALGAVTFVILIFAGFRYTVMSISARMVDKDSAAYANESMKAIVTSWNAQELVNRAHPDLLAKTDPQAFTALFDKIRQIGKAKKIEECVGQASISYPSLFRYAIGGGSVTNARYICKGEFEQAPVALLMTLHKGDEAGWQILAINIDSPFFKKDIAKPAPAASEQNKTEDK